MRPDPSPTSLQAVQRQLEQRAQRLRDELNAQDARRSIGSDGVADTKDLADRRSTEWLGDAEADRDRDELRRIETALERLATGRYGECTACGERIATARLVARPEATLCLRCQQDQERAPAPSHA